MRVFFVALFLTALLVGLAPSAEARAWWGDGYRPNSWVLANGGTIIYYKIIPKKSNKDGLYKAVMYTVKKKKYVEVESGLKGKFDDAKDKEFRIKAKRGSNTKSPIGGSAFASIEFKAVPGKAIYIVFDEKKRRAYFTDSSFTVKK